MRKYLKSDQLADIDCIVKELTSVNEKIQLSFDLKEKGLIRTNGGKILTMLNGLANKNVKFEIIRPLPRCLFSIEYEKITKEFNIPKNCYECADLFIVENETIKSCDVLHKEGPKTYYMNKKKQVWEFFNTLRLERKPAEKCTKCMYFKRKICDGLCFRT